MQRAGGPQIGDSGSAPDLFRTLRQSRDFMVADELRICVYTQARTHMHTSLGREVVNFTEQEWIDEVE